MLDDLDKLTAKIKEIATTVTTLRAENQQLRAQLVAASAELDAMNTRVDEAARRLDALLQRLPEPIKTASPSAQWKT